MLSLFKFYNAQPQFLKFLFIGGINTLFGYSIFSLLIYLGVHYTVALLLATCTGILFNFKTTGKFVFGSTNGKLIIRFIAVYSTVYFLNLLIIKVGSYFIENIYIIGGIAALVVAIIAYSLNKHFVFHE